MTQIDGIFDVSDVENGIEPAVKYKPEAVTAVKSAVWFGYMKNIREKTGRGNYWELSFRLEFLWESKVL